MAKFIRNIYRLALTILLLALTIGLPCAAHAQSAAVLESCTNSGSVTIGTSATTICTLPTFATTLFQNRGTYSYCYRATCGVTNTGTVTTTTLSPAASGTGASSPALTGIASVTVPMSWQYCNTFSPSTATTYPNNSTGVLTALGAAGTATLAANACFYSFEAHPQAIN